MILIASTVIFVLALMPSVVPMMFFPMLFTTQSNTEKWYLWLLVCTFFSFPFVVVGSLIAAWIFYTFGKQELAIWLSCLPYLNVLTAGLTIVFGR